MSTPSWSEIQEYLDKMSDAENDAIDIYNGWVLGFLSREKALSFFDQRMFEDENASFWFHRIWKRMPLEESE